MNPEKTDIITGEFKAGQVHFPELVPAAFFVRLTYIKKM